MGDWVDLYNYMYHQGILFLCHELDDELTNQLIGSMLFLEHKNRSDGPGSSQSNYSKQDSGTNQDRPNWYSKSPYGNDLGLWDDFLKFLIENEWEQEKDYEFYLLKEEVSKIRQSSIRKNSDDSELQLIINSQGGSVTCGLALFDTMQFLSTKTTTLCAGLAASVASFVLAGGDEGFRYSLPNARIMIHQPEGATRGQASEVLEESLEVLRIRRKVARLYAFRTGVSLPRIAADMDRDFFISASQAREYGLIRYIVFKNNNFGNTSNSVVKKLAPLYQLIIGLIVGNSLVALIDPPGWFIWVTIGSLEIISIIYSKPIRFKQILAIQRFRRGFLLALILDAFRLGS